MDKPLFILRDFPEVETLANQLEENDADAMRRNAIASCVRSSARFEGGQDESKPIPIRS